MFEGPSQIIRTIEGTYYYNLTIFLAAGLYNVLSTAGDTNYVIKYVLSDTLLTDPATAPSMTEVEASDSALNMHIEIGESITLRVNITVMFDFDACEAMKYMCFAITTATRASYTESIPTNNLQCADITSLKECYPRMVLYIL